MKTLIATYLITLLMSCTTERQLQIQTGYVTAADGHVRFEEKSTWRKIPFDTSFNSFRVRNIAVKKN